MPWLSAPYELYGSIFSIRYEEKSYSLSPAPLGDMFAEQTSELIEFSDIMSNVINAPETGQNNVIDTSLGWLFLVA